VGPVCQRQRAEEIVSYLLPVREARQPWLRVAGHGRDGAEAARLQPGEMRWDSGDPHWRRRCKADRGRAMRQGNAMAEPRGGLGSY
jgi:hypothetical protein